MDGTRTAASGRRRARLFRGVKALVLDVDGVLTDGGEYWTRRGEALKRFDTQDGKGMDELLEAGIKIAIISGEKNRIARRYAKSHRIKDARIGVKDKLQALKEFAGKNRIPLEAVVYVGDDEVDLPCMKAVGVPVSLPNAVPAVRKAARLITRSSGGHGAIRELADLILARVPRGSA
jgi:3-deoxy-D-manno-octulosonate 8-phosphate phosphatase (KDO 8-P phosphatase)